MPRYIDADELPKVKFHDLPYTHIYPADLIGLQTEAYERGWNDAIDAIVGNAETADVVEVVRCKDCKHRPYTDDEGDIYPHSWDDETCPCTCEDSYYNWMPEDDFFCKRGERKE